MKRNGFTLVELLGVIVLLGILGVIIVPKVGDSISNSKNNAYNVQVESIKKGVSDFLIDHSDMIATDGIYTINLGVIKQGGYLPIEIKNPKTRKLFANDSKIFITVTGGKYEISFELKDLIDVTEGVNKNSPILILNGNYIEYVEVNTPYIEKGATAKSSSGGDLVVGEPQIKFGESEIGEIDTSSLNTYSFVYTATDDDNSVSATRTVIVRDSTPPVIKIPTNTTISANQVSTFDVMSGVVISDNYDTNVNVTTNSTLANLPGNYVITYTATDASGNSTTERRVINVSDVTNNFAYKINGNTIASSSSAPTMENPITYTGLGTTGYIDIASTGKNLFDKSKYLKMEDYRNTGAAYTRSNIYLKPNTTYKISITRYNDYSGTDNGNLLISTGNVIHNGRWAAIASSTLSSVQSYQYVQTTKQDGLLYIGYYIRGEASKLMTQLDLDTIWANTDVQIEEGESATEFEPYKGGTTRIDMTGHEPLMCVDDTCDYIDYNSKKIVRYVKKLVFDDIYNMQISNWYLNNWSGQETELTQGIYYYNYNILGTYNSSKFLNIKGFSTHFALGDTAHTSNDILRFSPISTSNPPYISFRIPLDSETFNWNNWLTQQKNAGTPLTVYIVLREPEYEDINLPSFDLYDGYQYFVTDGNISSTIEIIR